MVRFKDTIDGTVIRPCIEHLVNNAIGYMMPCIEELAVYNYDLDSIKSNCSEQEYNAAVRLLELCKEVAAKTKV